MSARSSTETLAQVYLTLFQERTISQAELARRCGLSDTKAVRRCLVDIQTAGMPLVSEQDHPHVYWSVPKNWLPGGVAIASADVVELIRCVRHAPASEQRDRLLRQLLTGAGSVAAPFDLERVLSPSVDEEIDKHLRLLEEAAAEQSAVTMSFFSSRRGRFEERTISVLRVVLAHPAKVVAVCHRDDRLKWFRVDNVRRAWRDPGVAYRDRDDDEIEGFVTETRFGFHEHGELVVCRFVVREPEFRWVERQLGRDFTTEPVPGGLRFEVKTASLTPLARFVVSLGGAARVETPELKAAVRELALGALGEESS